jgi:1,4-dihydroxy-2-naphthoate octaprenyltransferase
MAIRSGGANHQVARTKMKDRLPWLGVMRLDYMYLDIGCVTLGAAAAAYTHGDINVLHAILAFIGGAAAHISVNSLNEYLDFRSGLDLTTDKTPFSGGTGTLPQRPDLAPVALGIAMGGLSLTVLIGLYFWLVTGWPIVPLGLLGLLLILTYTTWITRLPALTLVNTGTGFGLLMVTGTYYVLARTFSWTALFAALPPFFLGNNLQLLNQFPDVEVDRAAGRRNLPILLGRRAGSILFGLNALLTYTSLLAGVWLGHLPPPALLGLLALPVGVAAVRGVYLYADNLPKLVPFMGLNVLLNIVTPLLMAVGLFVAAWL